MTPTVDTLAAQASDLTATQQAELAGRLRAQAREAAVAEITAAVREEWRGAERVMLDSAFGRAGFVVTLVEGAAGHAAWEVGERVNGRLVAGLCDLAMELVPGRYREHHDGAWLNLTAEPPTLTPIPVYAD